MTKTITALALAALVAVGCSEMQDDRGVGDAPSDQQPDRPVKVWPGSDKFHNSDEGGVLTP